MDSFLCTLTCENNFDKDSLSPTDQFLLLGRVRARSIEKGDSTTSIYDLQYLVGLTFPKRPRSLWLIYDYFDINDDGTSLFQSRPYYEYDQYEEAEAILEDPFDLGRICEEVDKWDPEKGLLEDKVKGSLASTRRLLGHTLRFKESRLPSGVTSESDPYLEREESPDREASPEQKSTSVWEASPEQKSMPGAEELVEQKSTPEREGSSKQQHPSTLADIALIEKMLQRFGNSLNDGNRTRPSLQDEYSHIQDYLKMVRKGKVEKDSED